MCTIEYNLTDYADALNTLNQHLCHNHKYNPLLLLKQKYKHFWNAY